MDIFLETLFRDILIPKLPRSPSSKRTVDTDEKRRPLCYCEGARGQRNKSVNEYIYSATTTSRSDSKLWFMSPFSPQKCISCRANRLHLSSQTPTFHLSNRSSRAAVDCVVADRGYTTGGFSRGANAIFTASVIQSFGLYRHRCFYDIVGLTVNLNASVATVI